MACNQTMMHAIAQGVIGTTKAIILAVRERESTSEHIRTTQLMPRMSGPVNI